LKALKGVKKVITLILSVTVIPVFRILRKPFVLLVKKAGIKLRRIKTNAFIKKRISEAGKGFEIYKVT
jgi:hypothetical protein